jgi:hypothetical protein
VSASFGIRDLGSLAVLVVSVLFGAGDLGSLAALVVSVLVVSVLFGAADLASPAMRVSVLCDLQRFLDRCPYVGVVRRR